MVIVLLVRCFKSTAKGEHMVNTARLNALLREEGITKYKLSRVLGISRQSLSNKINNKTKFTSMQVLAIKRLFGLDNDTLVSIFFEGDGACEAPLEA